MPRFVILEHDHPVLHCDLMLEAGEVLQTWRLPRPPEPGLMMEATALGDHRPAYLAYEGPVSGNRGTVKRWDAGDFEEAADSTAITRCVLLNGQRVQGRMVLAQGAGAKWLIRWEG